jgi:glycosyltransferase involved in cell wall biosynthesis
MRVMHTEWAGEWSGQEMRVLQDMRILRDAGVDVFLATRTGTPLYRKAEAAGFPVLPVPFRRTLDPISFWRVFRAVRRHRIDIVNTHSGKDTWMAGLAARLAGAAFVRTQHFLKPRRWYRSHWIYRFADHVITTGEGVRQGLIRHCRVRPERITSIPSGPDHRHFDPQRFDRAHERARLGLQEADVAVGMLSRLTPRKGIREFLQAVALLLREHGTLRVFVAGDGKQAAELRDHVQTSGLGERVQFLGFLDDPAGYLAALDVFVLPSLNEGLPQALLQALLMGVPAVATRVGSIEELGTDAMLLVEPQDVTALSAALRRIVTDAELRHRMAGAARHMVLTGGYTEDYLRERMVGLYRRLRA